MGSLKRLFALLCLGVALAGGSSPAWADNYAIKDGSGSVQVLAAKLFGGVLHPLHVLEGLLNGSGAPQAVCVDDGSHGAPAGAICQVKPDVRTTGTLNAATLNATYSVAINNGQGVAGFTVSGLAAAAATLTIEGSNDGGSTWSTMNKVDGSTGALTSTMTADGQFRLNVGGRTNVRLRVSSIGSGTVSLAVNQASSSSEVALSAPLPPGANAIGAITNTAFGLSAGTSIVGKVGIDQTTPGTTNGVVVNGTASVLAPQASVTEAKVAMTGLWVKVWTAGAAKRLVIGLASDSAASGDYSFNAALAGANTSGGIPFAGGAGGSFDFAGGAIPNSDLYVKATNGSSVTVQVFN